MERIFGRPIVTQEQMRTRIRELGRQIAADYANKDLVLIGVLKGAYAFYADLARAIRIPMRPGLRSINVAVAAAMILGEALRQTAGFATLT